MTIGDGMFLQASIDSEMALPVIALNANSIVLRSYSKTDKDITLTKVKIPNAKKASDSEGSDDKGLKAE